MDTGASHSIICAEFLSLHGFTLKSSTQKHVTIGDSTQTQILGECRFTFKLHHKTFEWNFLVLNKLPYDVVLGSDFLYYAKIVLDIPNLSFYFTTNSKNSFPFVSNPMFCMLEGLTEERQTQLNAMLHEFKHTLSGTIGHTDLVQCKLDVVGTPVAQKPYNYTPTKRKLIKQHVNEMLELGIIRPSESEWASPVNMQKQGDTYRFCLDYRVVNSLTRNDPFPHPRIETLVNKLADAKFISKLDLRKGYWQIGVHPDSVKYTTFICDEGKFEFLRMPFGLKTAPAIFQRFVNKVLGKSRDVFAAAYLDDIIIYSNSWEDHLDHIKYVLTQLRNANLTVNLKKCSFAQTSMEYLGYVITSNGISINQEKLAPITDYPTPRTAKDVKRFVGLCGWYRQYIENFATVMEPLNRCLRKDIKFCWSHEQQIAFDRIKQCIVNATALALPNFDKQFILRTDSSDLGLGAVLAQEDEENNERPIAFASRTLTRTEQSYHATEKECLSIVWSLKKFESYLDGQSFILQTDNQALLWLDKMKDVNSKFMRWALRIQDFQPIISHCPGKLNVVADALSRAPVGEAEEEDRKSVMDPPTQSNFLFFSSLSSLVDKDSLKLAQKDDGEIQSLLTDLPNGFILEDDILYKLGRNNEKLIFIPRSFKGKVLNYFHDAPHSGHLGYRKTIARIMRRFFWFHMHEDIYAYIRACTKCQATKNPNTKPYGEMQPVYAAGPWDMLAMDLIGPLPTTANRNTQLLVVVDHFSKWVELFPLTKATAPKIATILENEIFCRYGSPKRILSDNGTNFRSKCLRQLCSAWGITQKFLSPYHPQSNITERINRNIRAILSSYIAQKHTKWDQYLAAVGLALRTAVSDTTGYSPSMLTFGREIKLPIDRAVETDSEEMQSRILHKTDLINKLQSLYTNTRMNIEKAQAQQCRYYNSRHKRMQFKVNDKVMLRSHFLSHKAMHFTKKFAYRWLGPFVVSKVISPVTYALCDPETKEDKGYQNVKNLKPYYDKPADVSFSSKIVSQDNLVVPSSSDFDIVSNSVFSRSPNSTGRTYNLRSRVVN